MTGPLAMGVAQIIDAEPMAVANPCPDFFVQDGEAIADLTFRRFSPAGRPPHPAPSLLLLATAADFRVARRIYGRRHGIPRLHLLRGADLSHWGHRAREEPAVRVAIGEGVAGALRRQGIFREPVLTLPVGFDPAHLASSAADRGPEPLLLAEPRPQLGKELEQALRQRGIASRLELFPSTPSRLERAIARAPVVVDLAPPTGHANPASPWLMAMALRTPLITIRIDPEHEICRNGRNALVCDADVQHLAEAVFSLLGSDAEALRVSLQDGARSTVAQHHPALQRLRFEQLLQDRSRHWQNACSAHEAAHTEPRSDP